MTLFDEGFGDKKPKAQIDISEAAEDAVFDSSNFDSEFIPIRELANDLDTSRGSGLLARISPEAIARVKAVSTTDMKDGILYDIHERHWDYEKQSGSITAVIGTLYMVAERRLRDASFLTQRDRDLTHHYYKCALSAVMSAGGVGVDMTVDLFNEYTDNISRGISPSIGKLSKHYKSHLAFLYNIWFGDAAEGEGEIVDNHYLDGFRIMFSYMLDVADKAIALGDAGGTFIYAEDLSSSVTDDVEFQLQIEAEGLYTKIVDAENLAKQLLGVCNSSLMALWDNRALKGEMFTNHEFALELELAQEDLDGVFTGAIFAYLVNMKRPGFTISDFVNNYINFEIGYGCKVRTIKERTSESVNLSALYRLAYPYWFSVAQYTKLFVKVLELNNITVIAKTQEGEISTTAVFANQLSTYATVSNTASESMVSFEAPNKEVITMKVFNDLPTWTLSTWNGELTECSRTIPACTYENYSKYVTSMHVNGKVFRDNSRSYDLVNNAFLPEVKDTYPRALLANGINVIDKHMKESFGELVNHFKPEQVVDGELNGRTCRLLSMELTEEQFTKVFMANCPKDAAGSAQYIQWVSEEYECYVNDEAIRIAYLIVPGTVSEPKHYLEIGTFAATSHIKRSPFTEEGFTEVVVPTTKEVVPEVTTTTADETIGGDFQLSDWLETDNPDANELATVDVADTWEGTETPTVDDIDDSEVYTETPIVDDAADDDVYTETPIVEPPTEDDEEDDALYTETPIEELITVDINELLIAQLSSAVKKKSTKKLFKIILRVLADDPTELLADALASKMDSQLDNVSLPSIAALIEGSDHYGLTGLLSDEYPDETVIEYIRGYATAILATVSPTES